MIKSWTPIHSEFKYPGEIQITKQAFYLRDTHNRSFTDNFKNKFSWTK